MSDVIDPQAPRPWKYRRLAGLLLNAWLAFHCVALFIAPAAMPPASPLFRDAWEYVSGYLDALYINHGYHYFAPEPAHSSLLGYRLTYADGRTEVGRIPHKGIQPRLLYHRYFMITEQFGGSGRLEPVVRQRWIEACARALGRETGAVRVTLTRIRHNLPTMERIRAGGSMEDPDLFEEEFLGTFDVGQAASLPGPQVKDGQAGSLSNGRSP